MTTVSLRFETLVGGPVFDFTVPIYKEHEITAKCENLKDTIRIRKAIVD